MVAVDTSTLIAFLQGQPGIDVEQFDDGLAARAVTLPPVVITEILSEPALPDRYRALVLRLPVIDTTDGYWIRTAAMRATILAKKLRARLPAALIAQSCIDHDVALITRDRDFRHFERLCGLQLA
jgi:predicted nucleic acid-binding protein